MSFKTNVIRSFKQVRQDNADFKNYTFEWINTIITNQKKLLQRIRELEQRIEQLEK